jgi:hypothetical protein
MSNAHLDSLPSKMSIIRSPAEKEGKKPREALKQQTSISRGTIPLGLCPSVQAMRVAALEFPAARGFPGLPQGFASEGGGKIPWYGV